MNDAEDVCVVVVVVVVVVVDLLSFVQILLY